MDIGSVPAISEEFQCARRRTKSNNNSFSTESLGSRSFLKEVYDTILMPMNYTVFNLLYSLTDKNRIFGATDSVG
jgi:hypothetical protein